MRETKMFSTLVLGGFITGVGLVAVGAGVGSEFLRTLGAFPLLLVMFLLPHALLEWEAPRSGRLGDPVTEEGAYPRPSVAAAEATTAARP